MSLDKLVFKSYEGQFLYVKGWSIGKDNVTGMYIIEKKGSNRYYATKFVDRGYDKYDVQLVIKSNNDSKKH